MKKLYVLLFFLTISSVFAQKDVLETNNIAAVEMRSASRTMNFQANANTLNYDVTYHKLELTVDPAVYFISGKVTTSFTALSNMNTVTFDLANELVVTAVKQGATNLSFVQNGSNELVITLPNTLTTGNSATVEMIYSGAPPQNAFEAFAINVHSGAAGMWTLSEPYGARDWWPCKQDLSDKISSTDVYITAPNQYVSAANGVEQSQVVNANGTKTTHFHHGYPIPAYLIAFAVTNYQVYTQTAGTAPNTFPIVNYIYPESYTSAVTALDQTLPIMNFFETTFEPYPFRNEKYGHAQFGWGGGMEHTTVSFMGNFSRGLIAHELAHQWFGDKITCGTWKDIWLNEGFATYLSALVIEHLDGPNAFISQKAGMVSFITSSPTGNLYLTDAQLTDVGRIFNSRISYNKGAMVLEMLRFKMGDTAFFQAIRNYLADSNLAFDYAVTTDLKAHLEAEYGQSLTEFFNDWVYNQGYPTYSISVQNWGSGQARFVVNQTQSHTSVSFFEMPIPVRVFGPNGETADLVLNNTSNGQEFIMSVPFEVTNIQFDPEVHLISRNSSVTLSNEIFSLDRAVVLYPNPSSADLHIQMPDTMVLEKVVVYNSLGQKVLENTNLDFEVSGLSAGVHYIDIHTSKGTYHKKFIKK
ncbi:M1 family aminopeptidase [Flavobacterium sp.]|jgi:aminopeptidase N|uniref:M1 family aminopeptidase n=1 Tax=Flavobacterium sp. TaxID=239 RepID=UPI0037BE3CD2